MAGVVKLSCIQRLPANSTAARRDPKFPDFLLSPTASIVSSGRITAPGCNFLSGGLRQSSCLLRHGGKKAKKRGQKWPNFAVQPVAKGNVRQRQKEKNATPPPPPLRPTVEEDGVKILSTIPISAPSLRELVLPEELPIEETVQLKSSGELFEAQSDNAEATDRMLRTDEKPERSGRLSWNPISFFRRHVLRRLSSLRLAIAELLVIAGLSALGTIIEQNEAPQFYFQNYPEENPMFGFLSWRVILDGSLDHIYSSWYYFGLLFLLASSLVACTTTRQFPIVKVARRWYFLKSAAAFERLPVSDTLEKARIGDFATLLMAEGFQVFVKGPAVYAFRGLAGRYAPIGVHIALLLIMGGATVSAIGGYHGTVMVPQGLSFDIGDVLVPKGILSVPSPVMNVQVQINKFFIDYLETGTVSQFHSDISLLNLKGKEDYRKTISVNDPLRYQGLTMYQTDWAISAIQLRVDGSEPYNLVMASLEKGDKKLFGTFLPIGPEGLDNAKGISILARDLQSVVIYDQEGKFVGVRRPGSGKPISVDGVSIVVDDLIGSSGLELKMDPGVPAVYAGFGALMLTTCISYLSHSQIWALQTGSSMVVGGKSNRAKVEFELQLNKILDLVPEIKLIPRDSKAQGSSSGDVFAAHVEGETLREDNVQIDELVTPKR